jgi:hypothetical protein
MASNFNAPHESMMGMAATCKVSDEQNSKTLNTEAKRVFVKSAKRSRNENERFFAVLSEFSTPLRLFINGLG